MRRRPRPRTLSRDEDVRSEEHRRWERAHAENSAHWAASELAQMSLAASASAAAEEEVISVSDDDDDTSSSTASADVAVGDRAAWESAVARDPVAWANAEQREFERQQRQQQQQLGTASSLLERQRSDFDAALRADRAKEAERTRARKEAEAARAREEAAARARRRRAQLRATARARLAARIPPEPAAAASASHQQNVVPLAFRLASSGRRLQRRFETHLPLQALWDFVAASATDEDLGYDEEDEDDDEEDSSSGQGFTLTTAAEVPPRDLGLLPRATTSIVDAGITVPTLLHVVRQPKRF